MHGNMGVGCISDFEPQPLITRSHHGTFAITTVGKINNLNQLADHILENRGTQFQEMSGGSINPTELVAAQKNEKDNFMASTCPATDWAERRSWSEESPRASAQALKASPT